MGGVPCAEPTRSTAMQGPVYSHLAPVRSRQQRLFLLRCASLGLLASAAVGLFLGLGKWLGGWQLAGWVAPLALLVWPKPQAVEAAPPEPIPEIVAVAKSIEEDLKEFEDLARQENNKDLENLVQDLKKKVEEMKQPGVDEREALSKLSEMQ